jgi:hypothetical protein
VGVASGLLWPTRSQRSEADAHDPDKSARRPALKVSSIVGYPNDASDAMPHLQRVRDPLKLRREPCNAHDAKAIVVEWEGFKLGYLRMDKNFAIPGLTDAGKDVAAGIAILSRTTKPLGRVLL